MENDNTQGGGFVVYVNSPGNQIIQTQNNHYYGTVYQGKAATENNGFSDEQVAQALKECVGKDKVIDNKQKWAGAYWYLRWVCHYPVDAKKFCDRIDKLPFGRELPIKCDYRNIRELTTLSFMDQNPQHMDSIQYSKNDEKVFLQCREVALKLAEELGKSYFAKA